MDVSLEVGKKKVFASAVDWPGWSRGGKDEAGALQALFDYAPRYAAALKREGVRFKPPSGVDALEVVERQPGSAATDFGVPELPLRGDDAPLDEAALERQLRILRACWSAFDAAVSLARGRQLRQGPRGGGRSVEKMLEHVLMADLGYLKRINQRLQVDEQSDLVAERERLWPLVRSAVESAVRDGVPESGPRGGKLWSVRYFIRRAAWHELDHAWELEDRILD